MIILSRRQTRTGLRGLAVLFVLVTLLRVWVGPMGVLAPAQAQIPDSGLQRKLLLDETRRTNQLLAEIKQLMETGTLNVKIQQADEQAVAPAQLRGRG